MPRGRPSNGPKKTTTIDLSGEERAAIRLLQAHREVHGRSSTMRELVVEGLNLVLAKEGLDPIARQEAPTTAAVVEIIRR